MNINTSQDEKNEFQSSFSDQQLQQQQQKQTQQMLFKISLNMNNKLGNYFPKDPHSDICISLVNTKQQFQLQKAYLRLESQYFQQAFDQNEKTKNIQNILINKKFDEKQFYCVLSCFYGNVISITIENLIQIYKICGYLKVEVLVDQLNKGLLQNFSSINFYILFHLAVSHKIESVLQKCEQYLQNSSFEVIKTDLINRALYVRLKYPSSFIDLIENAFVVLMRMLQKSNQIQNTGIYEFIKIFAQNKYKVNDYQEKINFLLENIYDKYSLNSSDYQFIFHNNQFLNSLNNNNISNINYNYDEVEGQLVNMSIDKTSQNIIHLIMSENYIYKKQIQEFKDDNKSLSNEIQKLRRDFNQTSILKNELSSIQEQQEDQISQFKSQFNVISNQQQEKINTLEQELKQIKDYLYNHINPQYSLNLSNTHSLYSKIQNNQNTNNNNNNQINKNNNNTNNLINNEMQSIDTQILYKSASQYQSNQQQNNKNIAQLMEEDCIKSVADDMQSFNIFYQTHLDSVKRKEIIENTKREENLNNQMKQQQNIIDNNQKQFQSINSSFFEPGNIDNQSYSQNLDNLDENAEKQLINQSFTNVTSNQKQYNNTSFNYNYNERINSTNYNINIDQTLNSDQSVLLNKQYELDKGYLLKKQKINQIKQEPLMGDMQNMSDNQTLESFFVSQKLQGIKSKFQIGLCKESYFSLEQFNKTEKIENIYLTNQMEGREEKDDYKLCNEQLIIDKKSRILDKEYDYEILLRFLGVSLYEKVRMKLIYRGSEDGFNQKSLICKVGCYISQGVLSIMKSKCYNKVFGGYSGIGLKMNNKNKEQNSKEDKEEEEDKDSFIYSLDHNKKFMIKPNHKSMQSEEEAFLQYGNDIIINHNCHLDDNSISLFPDSYQSQPHQDYPDGFLAGSYNFSISEIELYSITLLSDMQI